MNAGEILNSTYEIKEQIGSGGGGTIYKAYHKRLQKDVVLKKIHQSAGRNEDEKEILKNIKHSYLPQVYDFLDAEDGVYTIIDYIPGRSFDKLLQEKKKFPPKKVVKYGRQLCEVVAYLHKQNPPIIHGDIKPANIMLTPEDDICLIDFNISGVLDGRSMTAMGYTPGYAPPEQRASFGAGSADFSDRVKAIGSDEETELVRPAGRVELAGSDDKTELIDSDHRTELIVSSDRMDSDNKTKILHGIASPSDAGSQSAGNLQDSQLLFSNAESQTFREQYTDRVDARSDIYSIGATLYHLLTGIRPDNDPDKIMKPSELDSSIGESISIILMKALHRDPKQRFQTVESMLAALLKIHKYDLRYKKMILRQELAFLASAVCIGAGVLLFFFGNQRLETEEEEVYAEAVAYLSDAVENGEEEQRIEEMYDAAVQMKPQRLEAYFQKALYYYEIREYETDIAYIEDKILSSEVFFEQEMIGDVYFILANCYFELEDYEEAVTCYRTALSRNGENPEYYRDYGIALVRLGEIESAQEILAEAEVKGLSSAELLLMNGELKKAKGEYEQAEQNLLQCIKEADDDYLKMRAYVICDMVYREADAVLVQGEENSRDTEYLLKSRNLLEEARMSVKQENRLLIYERLAQTYIDLLELTSDNDYGESAVAVLQDVIAQGWGTYLTYNNIAILYQKMGQSDKAEDTLNRMLELDAENYNTYKRLAFLELEKQDQKDNAQREYEDFLIYYEKSVELYQNVPSAGNDVEMQLLDDFHRQLEEGGWLK